MIGRNPFPAWRLPNGKTNATDAQLEIVSSSCERWELACAALVVIAVVAEVIIAWMHWAYDLSLQQWGSVDTDAAIALGIVGEVAFSRKDAGIQTELRNRSNQKLADAVTAAGEANDRASQADLARAKLEAALHRELFRKNSTMRLSEPRAKSPDLIWLVNRRQSLGILRSKSCTFLRKSISNQRCTKDAEASAVRQICCLIR